MGLFVTPLDTRQQGKFQHRLLGALAYNDDQFGGIVVPEGFETDFASVYALRDTACFSAGASVCTALCPVLPSWAAMLALVVALVALALYAIVVGYGNKAATVHDYLYSWGRLTRRQADAVLYRGLRAEGVAAWRAWLFWLGVRLGGASHFKK